MAIGTLIFTGVTTIYQAQVSENQLQQAEEDAARRVREQAARVTIWIDGAEAQSRIHVRNGSTEPVSLLTVVFRLWHVGFVLDLQGLAPCSEAVFNKSMLRYIQPPGAKPVPPEVPFSGLSITFYDADGKLWFRTLATLEPPPEDLTTSSRLGRGVKALGHSRSGPTVKASSCR